MIRHLRTLGLLTLAGIATAQEPLAQDVVKERFAAQDTNGDGKISLEESPRPDLMPRVDTDGDGQASFAEFSAFLRALPRSRFKDDAVKRVWPPKEVGDGKAFEAAANYLESKNGHAMLVYLDGQLVFERYFNDYVPTQPHVLASGTKSFSGAMAVAAIEDGLLELDEKVVETLTEWQDDERMSRVTVRQLLSLRSGIDGGDNGRVPSYADAVKLAEAVAEPGSKFSYGPIPFQCFGELMRRKLEPRGESVEAYLKRRILQPIGLEPNFWRKDSDGNIHLPSGAFLTPDEWARFGLFIQRGGMWSGEQLLDPELLRQCFKGSKANPNYGLTFWLNAKGPGPRDLVMAAGKGKQKLYIIPSLKLMVLQFADARGYQENEFLNLVLQDVEDVRG
jgi:CubicO group peptidase (beta-lactamase class C family)